MYQMENLTFPLTSEQLEALSPDRLLPDIFMDENAVCNIGRGIRQMVKISVDTGKSEQLITYMPDLIDLMYCIGRIEQDLRNKRYAENEITASDLNETLDDH